MDVCLHVCIRVSAALKEKNRCKALILKTNGTLQNYTLMVYWSRPGVGIKENEGSKQAILCYAVLHAGSGLALCWDCDCSYAVVPDAGFLPWNERCVPDPLGGCCCGMCASAALWFILEVERRGCFLIIQYYVIRLRFSNCTVLGKVLGREWW